MREPTLFMAAGADPVRPRRLPWSTYFVDVSNNQGPHMDFRQVARDSKHTGITCVEMKATEGTGFVDPYFHEWRDECERVGLRTFAYHFARPDEHHGPGAASNGGLGEADHFCNVVGKVRPGEWRPMLDFETAPFDAYFVHAFNIRVKERLGVAPCLYSYWSALIGMRLHRPLSDGLILASWNGQPRTAPCPAPWRRWAAHQYTDHGYLRGIGACDLNWTPNVWNLLAYPVRGAALEPLYAARRRRA